VTPKPTRGQSTNSSQLHVEWTKLETDELKGGSEIIYYSVYINEETDAVQSTAENFWIYVKDAANTDTSATFQVTATNIYGEGPKSEVSDAILFGAVPDKLADLKSENVDTENEQATITWTAPSADADITEFIFQVLNLDTNEYADASSIMTTVDGNDSGRQFDCNTLITSYGYQKGDKIEFRVAVENDFGQSEWGYPSPTNKEAISLSMLIL
jgi:hypothetical protein